MNLRKGENYTCTERTAPIVSISSEHPNSLDASIAFESIGSCIFRENKSTKKSMDEKFSGKERKITIAFSQAHDVLPENNNL